MNKKYINKIYEQSGATIVVVAASMFLIASIVALSLDVGYLYVTRNELQNAADAAALGATRQLAKLYQSENFKKLTFNQQMNYNISVEKIWDGVNGDESIVKNTAIGVAFLNKSAQDSILIDANEIYFGSWDTQTDKFTEADILPTAVSVVARRDSSNANTLGNVTLFIAGIFGIESSAVVTRATAALTGQSVSEPGELELPIGLSKSLFDGTPSKWCGNIVKFSPPKDPDACAGWTGFDLGNATKNEINPIIDGSHEVPATYAGQLFYFTNAVQVSDIFKNLLIKYGLSGYDVDSIYTYDASKNYDDQDIPVKVTSDDQRVPLCLYSGVLSRCNDGDVEKDDVHLRYPNLDFTDTDGGNQQKNFSGPFRYAHEWETTLPVYDSDTCTPTQDIPILGYVRVVVYDVGYPSNAYVYARISCDITSPDETRGGGVNLGVFGSIPGLVE